MIKIWKIYKLEIDILKRYILKWSKNIYSYFHLDYWQGVLYT